ncbi:hypothetical protein [Gemmata sp.]|uniref:hypothetical protein n=1 Tax=Gemmata sp. TaxID=1914242 RepID=UPI003F6EEA02
MTTAAQCPQCGHEFTFRTSVATFAATVRCGPDGRPLVRACYEMTCPACRTDVRVPSPPAPNPIGAKRLGNP